MRLILLFIMAMTTLLTFGQHEKPQTIALWPGNVPGGTKEKQLPVFEADQHDNILRIAGVTNPAMVVYNNCRNCSGAAVIVCPGGGYEILAIDLEGYEIATWLNSIGITAFVLQYRVPGQRDGALQDLQRAVRLVRENAGNWNLDPGKIGVMGFSAGGSLSARLCTLSGTNLYPAVDRADKQPFMPDFGMLIYPAYLDQGPASTVSPENTPKADTPPMFLFATADDPYANSTLVMAQAMRGAKRPVELHLLPEGGHGYGLRKGSPAAETWPVLAEKWLNSFLKGFIKPPLNHEE